MKHNSICSDKRYQHKLNMLEPGLIMMKIVGGLFVAGVLFWLAQWRLLAAITLLLSGTVFAILLILVVIEAHQDKVMNNKAIGENIELEIK